MRCRDIDALLGSVLKMLVITIVIKSLSTLPVLRSVVLLPWSGCWKLSVLSLVWRIVAALSCKVSGVVTVVTAHCPVYAGGVSCPVWSSAAGAVVVVVLSVWWVPGVLLSIPVDVYVDGRYAVGVLVVVLVVVVVLRVVVRLLARR